MINRLAGEVLEWREEEDCVGEDKYGGNIWKPITCRLFADEKVCRQTVFGWRDVLSYFEISFYLHSLHDAE